MLLCHFGYGAYGPARRGKRLRPQMVLRVAVGEGAPIEAALDAAVAVEIFHNYSLVHDDIEDGDELRHGRPTLWSRFGIAPAIAAGDTMCALAFTALGDAIEVLDESRVYAMLMVLHEAHAVMCEGQSLDLRFESEPLVDLAAYHHMIACKTSALFAASCRLGALAAGCGPDAVERYGALGHAYGMAFQIQDDVHGIWSPAAATGKVSGHDIARRKWTFPVAWAIGGPPSPARSVVADAYARGRALDAADVERVVGALDALGAREAAATAVAEAVAVVERHPNRELGAFLLGSLDGAIAVAGANTASPSATL